MEKIVLIAMVVEGLSLEKELRINYLMIGIDQKAYESAKCNITSISPFLDEKIFLEAGSLTALAKVYSTFRKTNRGKLVQTLFDKTEDILDDDTRKKQKGPGVITRIRPFTNIERKKLSDILFQIPFLN
ncbi:MAG: hypothetical protein KBC11_02360 [Candidatus Pacebacteria bacterium]|nr:hypothetical protein [Candidatus Paceibacterota bacterium]